MNLQRNQHTVPEGCEEDLITLNYCCKENTTYLPSSNQTWLAAGISQLPACHVSWDRRVPWKHEVFQVDTPRCLPLVFQTNSPKFNPISGQGACSPLLSSWVDLGIWALKTPQKLFCRYRTNVAFISFISFIHQFSWDFRPNQVIDS